MQTDYALLLMEGRKARSKVPDQRFLLFSGLSEAPFVSIVRYHAVHARLTYSLAMGSAQRTRTEHPCRQAWKIHRRASARCQLHGLRLRRLGE